MKNPLNGEQNLQMLLYRRGGLEEARREKEGDGQEARATIIITLLKKKKSQLKAEGRRWGELAGDGTY